MAWRRSWELSPIPSGAVVAGASVEVREVSIGKRVAHAKTNAAGQFSLSGLPAGDYVVQVSMPGFKIASQELTLRARDRAVLSATLAVGAASEAVEVTAAQHGRSRSSCRDDRQAAAGVAGGVAGGVMGGVSDASSSGLPINGRNVMELADDSSQMR